MDTHPKTSRIIPYTITLSSPYNHQDYLRKHPKFPFNLYLNSILEDQPGQLDPKIKEQNALLKIFRGLKYLNKIHQNDLALHRIRLPASKTKYIIKRVQRVRVLDIQDRLALGKSKVSPARLDLWLKYGKDLKSINYQFADGMFGVNASIPLVEREIQLSLKFLPQHSNLRTFEIRLPHSNHKTLQSLLEFQRYPSSLKTFAIYQQHAADPKELNNNRMGTAFSRLKSLESFSLVGTSMLKLTLVLLGKVPSLLNVKKLNVQQGGWLGLGSVLDLNNCQAFQNLRHVKIGNIAGNKTLAKLTNPPQLKSLEIESPVGVKGLGLISEFISLFSKSLKCLKIYIQHPYVAESEEKVKSLFSKISELEMLTSFRFKVNEGFSSKIVTISPAVLENLKGLFLKSVKLESFEWEVPQISGPGVLFDLFKLLEGSCLTLRKLKIPHATMDLEKSQKAWVLNFLRRLEKIEELYLTCLDIKEEAFWVDLVNCLKEMKLLRSLGIGYMTSSSQEEWFIKPVETMLKKRGLEMLRIGTTFKIEAGEKERLNLREIMKANPALREVSNTLRQLFNTTGLE